MGAKEERSTSTSMAADRSGAAHYTSRTGSYRSPIIQQVRKQPKYTFALLSFQLFLVLTFCRLAYSLEINSNMASKTVMVTGANGFLASYIVKDLLASGHTVHACVRDAGRECSVNHLKSLPGARDRLKLFSTGDLSSAKGDTKPFDPPMKSCHAVMHTATPINVKFGENDGEKDIYQPAMTSTEEILRCLGRNADTVKCLVLTSSMAAVAPRPEPAIKDESHWSDPKDQRARKNWYGTTKTSQELLVRDFVRQAKSKGTLSEDFVFAALCPTMVIGPLLRPPDKPNVDVGGTMGSLQKWLRGSKSIVPNDSMSFIHVEDCAKMHTRILELAASDINPHQRYMALIESLHWNNIIKLMKELHPDLPPYTEYDGSDGPLVRPTKFNLDNMKSLGVPYKTTQEAMADSIKYLKEIGALGS